MVKSITRCLGILILLVVLSGCQDSFSGRQKAEFKIAFARLTDGYWQLWTMNSDGSSQKQITKTRFDKRYPIWLPDGKIVFRSNNHKVFVTDLSGNEKQILKGISQIGGIAASPNGDDLVFVRIKDHSRNKYNLWTAKTDGTDTRMMTHASGKQYDPAWSSDGDKIAYIQCDGYRQESLCLIGKDGDSNVMKLTDSKGFTFLPSFSPDGKKIAYVSDVTGDYEIWLTDIVSKDKKQITSAKGIDTKPTWTPDGQSVCFMSNRQGTSQVYMMNADGSDVKQLTIGKPAMDPACERIR